MGDIKELFNDKDLSKCCGAYITIGFCDECKEQV